MHSMVFSDMGTSQTRLAYGMLEAARCYLRCCHRSISKMLGTYTLMSYAIRYKVVPSAERYHVDLPDHNLRCRDICP